MQKKASLVAVLGIAIFFSACGKKDESTPWDHPITDPIIQSTISVEKSSVDGSAILKTQFCYPDSKGPYGDKVKYTDVVGMSQGHVNDGGVDNVGYDYGQGGACVNRSIQETWAVLQNQALLVWGGVTTSSFSTPTPPAGISAYYLVNYHVDNPFPEPSVDWQMDWFHSVHSGTISAPKQIVINYRKVNGTHYIKYWEGSIILDYISPTITAISVVDHVNAARTDANDSAGTAGDIIQKARTGAPNPIALANEQKGSGPSLGTTTQGLVKTAFCYPDAKAELGGLVKYTNEVNVSNSHDDKNNYYLADGGACIFGSFQEAWDAVSSANFMDWSAVAFTANVQSQTPANGDYALFHVDYTNPSGWFFLSDSSWAMEWTQRLVEGTSSDPKLLSVYFKKVSGESNIRHWSGEVDLKFITPTITAITVHNELDMDGKSAEDVENQVRVLIRKSRIQTLR